MAVRFVLQPKKNPMKGTIKKYAQIAPIVETKTIDDAVRYIEKISAMSSGDIKSVLDGLQDYIILQLSDGHSVRLGDLGSFRITITSDGVDMDETDFDPESLIKKVHVRFAESSRMLRDIKKDRLKFHLVEPNTNEKKRTSRKRS